MKGDLDRLAGRQWGLASFVQLRHLGYTPDEIRSMCRRGLLIRRRHGVYRMRGVPETQEQAWLSAVLASGGDPVICHGTAAAAHAFKDFPMPDAVDLLVCGRPRPRHEGVRGHSTTLLPAHHRTVVSGVPATSVERTLLDACGLVDARTLSRAASDLERRKVLHIPRLVKVVEEAPVPGRRKLRPVHDLLSERVPGYHPGGSDRELDVMKALRGTGRPLPVQQHRVRIDGRTYFLDFAWPDLLESFEWDGWEAHGQFDPFHDDRTRWRRLQRAGWRIWPLTSRTTVNEILAIVDEFTANPRRPVVACPCGRSGPACAH